MGKKIIYNFTQKIFVYLNLCMCICPKKPDMEFFLSRSLFTSVFGGVQGLRVECFTRNRVFVGSSLTHITVMCP